MAGSTTNPVATTVLPTEVAVYVPSTQGPTAILTQPEMDARVKDVETFLATSFGGYTSLGGAGGWVSTEAGLIKEPVVRVSSFTDRDPTDIASAMKVWVEGKLAEWVQEAIAVEFDGDLAMFTPKGVERATGTKPERNPPLNISRINGTDLKRRLDAKRVLKRYHNKHRDGSGNFGYYVVFKDQTTIIFDGRYSSDGTVGWLKVATWGGSPSNVEAELMQLVRDALDDVAAETTPSEPAGPSLRLGVGDVIRLPEDEVDSEVLEVSDRGVPRVLIRPVAWEGSIVPTQTIPIADDIIVVSRKNPPFSTPAWRDCLSCGRRYAIQNDVLLVSNPGRETALIRRGDGVHGTLTFEKVAEGFCPIHGPMTVINPPGIGAANGINTEKLDERLLRQGNIAVVVGRRGSGKSAFGFAVAEEAARQGRETYIVGFPTEAAKFLPKTIKVVDTVEKVPNGAFALLDEAVLLHNAREWHKNGGLTRIVDLARQKELSLVFVTLNSAMVDTNILRAIDTLIIKEPSLLQEYMERPWFKKFLAKALKHFDALPREEDRRSWCYVFDSVVEGMARKGLPAFWTDELSKSWKDYTAPVSVANGSLDKMASKSLCFGCGFFATSSEEAWCMKGHDVPASECPDFDKGHKKPKILKRGEKKPWHQE